MEKLRVASSGSKNLLKQFATTVLLKFSDFLFFKQMHLLTDNLSKSCSEKFCQFHRQTSASILGIESDLQSTDSVLNLPGWLRLSKKLSIKV